MFRCLVCGYNQMPHPPKDYNICPCCGTEYGLDDAFDSYELLRDKWLEKGAPWLVEKLDQIGKSVRTDCETL